jgi:hypothetical protein
MQHGFVEVPIDLLGPLGVSADEEYIAKDLLTDAPYVWRGRWNYVRFEPGVCQGHILKLEIKNSESGIR